MNVGGQANVALAEALATWAHTGQTDKNGYDYIGHPLAVCGRVYFDDETDYDAQIVALLHDTVEDQRKKVHNGKLFRMIFPAYICDAIEAITYRFSDPTETLDEYYARVRANPIALRVKLHDISHNTSPRRMDKLEPEVRARLIKKYRHALEELNK
jgi:(p)ppGpp synthase/HD superfamily hydrolase